MFPRSIQGWLARWRASRAPLELRLYTRARCPLCVAMKAELARARVHPPFRLLEIDIENDPDLRARYGASIPVLEIAGRAAFKGRLTVAEFERRYTRRLAEVRAQDAAGGARAAGEAPHG